MSQQDLDMNHDEEMKNESSPQDTPKIDEEMKDQEEAKYIITNKDDETEWKYNPKKSKEKTLPPDMIIDMDPLLNDPIRLERVSKLGSDVASITQITKFIQTEGSGEAPDLNDRIVHCMEIRYSNGYLYDFQKRKESKAVTLEDSSSFNFLQDCLRSMKKDEISIFKIQFGSPDDNFYLKDEHSQKFLKEKEREAIEDRTYIFMKLTVKSILRDCKDISSSELKKIKEDAEGFIDNRIAFALKCKNHAKTALTEKSLNEAMKIYRKGVGSIKMISGSLVKEARAKVVERGKDKEEELEMKINYMNDLRVQILLNLGFCHWKKEEWEKMKSINSEIIQFYDTENIKALYRFSIACKELECYDEGLKAMITLIKIEPKNKEAVALYRKLKEISKSKKNKWNKKMDGFFVKQNHSYHKIADEELKKDILRKKIEVELNSEPQ
ncbi:unnamed protein product [Moneuplotes crassus]|uniref:Uncharacterized protein n=1 Tax=Euplotes crassus TaxID=5936 RepID=A0AAD1UEP6_EUPCR|nr:unnamed protein product [Moneuplotes crassus]